MCPTAGPIEPVAIVGAFGASDFGVAFDGGLVMRVERAALPWGEVPFTLLQPPIFFDDPGSGFVGVSADGPAFEVAKKEMVHFDEGPFG